MDQFQSPSVPETKGYGTSSEAARKALSTEDELSVSNPLAGSFNSSQSTDFRPKGNLKPRIYYFEMTLQKRSDQRWKIDYH
jgi:hypothetical protein